MAGKELEGESESSSPAADVPGNCFSSMTTESVNSTGNPTGSSLEIRSDTAELACDNVNAASGTGSEPEETLKVAEELDDKGRKALKENDFAEAVDCLSRALEIRVAHFGELAPECMSAYYQYGKSLLYKAQDEADPIGVVPKKEANDSSLLSSNKEEVTLTNEEVSTISASASVSNKVKEEDSEHPPEGEESSESEDDEDLADRDEDEPDLDLAWKMLDVARAISEKHGIETMEKVDILSALAEVALEREDIETSLSDYQKALQILQRIVEPDSRYLAELYFRICLCLEIGYKPEEAAEYCKNALSVCRSRIQRLKNESESSEIETLMGLTEELEKKLEDLHQLIANPKTILSEILATVQAKNNDKSSSAAMNSTQMALENNGAFDSPTVSTAHSNSAGVMHLGVVGRGVKRVATALGSAETSPAKKPLSDVSSESGNEQQKDK